MKKMKSHKRNDIYPWIIKNISAFIIVSFAVGFFVFKLQPGYSWVNKMLKTNMEFINKNPKASFNEKMFSKLGVSFGYVNFIKESTSPNSVILYPEKTDLFPENQKTEFRHDMYNKLWALRFVHPRKIIMPSELGKTKESGSITHIAIVNGKGYEKLNYDPGNKPNFGIFPLKK